MLKAEGDLTVNTSHCLLWAFIALLPALAGCYGSTTNKPDAASTAEANEYNIKGKVAAIGSDKRSVTLDHEDIPELMKGMEMEFRVDDPGVLEGIEVGDQVDGRLRVQEGSYTITKLQKP